MSEGEKGLRPILLIEDDEAEVAACISKFERGGVLNPVIALESAGEAFEFLTRRGRHAGHTERNPGVVLLDLSLPDTHGSEFLEFLKEKRMKIPIIVLTDSESTQSPSVLRGMGADGVIDKPIGLDGFLRAVNPMNPDWLEMKQFGKPSSGIEVEGEG